MQTFTVQRIALLQIIMRLHLWRIYWKWTLLLSAGETNEGLEVILNAINWCNIHRYKRNTLQMPRISTNTYNWFTLNESNKKKIKHERSLFAQGFWSRYCDRSKTQNLESYINSAVDIYSKKRNFAGATCWYLRSPSRNFLGSALLECFTAAHAEQISTTFIPLNGPISFRVQLCSTLPFLLTTTSGGCPEAISPRGSFSSRSRIHGWACTEKKTRKSTKFKK